MRHHLYFLISVLGYTSITLAWREIEDDIYVPCYHSQLRELPPRKRKGARPCSDNATTTLRQSRAQRKRNNIYTTLAMNSTREQKVEKIFIDVVVSWWSGGKTDISWTNFFEKEPNLRVLVYDHGNSTRPYKVPINKGREASTYLKYIVDHYDALPTYVFFVHDEWYSWHHKGTLLERYRRARASKRHFFNINNSRSRMGSITASKYYKSICEWYATYIEDRVSMAALPDPNWTNHHRGAAQFLVHRSRILRYDRAFYERLYEWILTTPLDDGISGRYLEWTWHVFWGISLKATAPTPTSTAGLLSSHQTALSQGNF